MLEGASYLSSSLHTVSHSVVKSQPQCNRCKKISFKTRLPFIEILKLHSVTSRNKIRLNQTVINRFFFAFHLFFTMQASTPARSRTLESFGVLVGVLRYQAVGTCVGMTEARV